MILSFISSNQDRTGLKLLIALGAFLLIGVGFYFAPIPVGFDFTIIHAALLRAIHGESAYQFIGGGGYFYPPWFSGLLSPLAIMEIRFAWVLVNCLSLVAVIAISRRFNLSLVNTALVLLSPPMFYNLMQGQIDALLLLVLFVPRQFWLLVALTKPQISIGFGFALLRSKPRTIIAALLIFLAVLLLSLFLFPNWLLDVVELSKGQFAGLIPQNFLNIWPLNFIVFSALIAIAVEKDDERIYIMSSPFVLKYASMGSYIGLLAAAFSWLKSWQAALVVFVWWLVLFVR